MGTPRPDPPARVTESGRRPTVLLVDDERPVRQVLDAVLRPHGYRLFEAEDGAGALELVRRHRVDVILLDDELGGEPDGLAVLMQVRQRFPDVEVIMFSAKGDVDAAVRAIKLGAFDFRTKSFAALSAAHDVIGRALCKQGVASEHVPRDDATRALDVGLVVGQSARMRELVEVVAKAAPAPATVLILGESGTGKELLARLVHRWSPRAERPFVAVNMAAIPSELAEATLFGYERGAFTGAIKSTIGKFEQADGGTLFLDEIGDLPPPLQAKLLRAIQEREIERIGAGGRMVPVDVRVVAATNRDLAADVAAGRFREDLYYRLNVIPLRVPPLRERRDEIGDLARFFARKFAARARREAPAFSERAMERLLAYAWPGNVRELENVIERLVTMCDRHVFDESDLPSELRVIAAGQSSGRITLPPSSSGAADPGGSGGVLQMACEAFEREYILQALSACHWNKAECARRLGISYATIKNKISRYSLVDPPLGALPPPALRGRR